MYNNSLSDLVPNTIQVKMLKGSLRNIPLPRGIFVVDKPSLSLTPVLLFRLVFIARIWEQEDF